MGFEVRAARLEEMEEYRRAAGVTLALSPETFAAVRPEWTLCGFEDGHLATSYAAWPLTMRFNGPGAPVAGVSGVGTLPAYRRRGNLRRIVTRHFELLHESGERSLAVLIAAWAAIYQRYGYAVVSARNSYRFEPRDLQFALDRPVFGSFRELGQDEFGLLVDLYRLFREERTGYLHRGRAMWEAGPLAHPPAGHLLSKAVYEEEGRPLGYVIYTVKPGGLPGPGQHITIRDLVWLTAEAYQAIWNYFQTMDLVESITWERVPGDDPLPHLLLEPRKLNMTSSDGLMARIVDVDKALPQRRYAEDGTLSFEVLDDLCPWNQGRWKLETSGPETWVASTRDDPELIMPISTLAMLVFGQISAGEAARMKRLDAPAPEALSKWDRMMRTMYRPFCGDIF